MSNSLTRAFTSRRGKASATANDGSGLASRFSIRSNREDSQNAAGIRRKISAPIQLIHTTNMLSYNAPDILRPATTAGDGVRSSHSSIKSDDDSATDGVRTASSSPPTSPDVAPGESCSSPDLEFVPAPDAFPEPILEAASLSAPPAPLEAPAVPVRAASRTKKASYEAANRSRSASRSRASVRDTVSSSTKASFTFSRSSSTSTSTSASSSSSARVPRSRTESSSESPFSSFKATAVHFGVSVPASLSGPMPEPEHISPVTAEATPAARAARQQRKSSSSSSVGSHYLKHSSRETLTERGTSPSPPPPVSRKPALTTDPGHPFGHELAQVTELAEEYGFGSNPDYALEEESELARKGLLRFGADVYIAEIDELLAGFYSDLRPDRLQVSPTVWI